jgi:heme exporter protein CcmD
VTHTGYLIAGYGTTFAVLATYAAWIVGRKRALTRQLPPDERDKQWQ